MDRDPDRNSEGGMDLATIILGIAVINVAVFLAGCTLAAVRTWAGRPSGSATYAGRAPEPLRHAGRRAH